MPNGGVPLHMVLHPKDMTPFVVYCRGGELSVVAQDKWDRAGAAAKPLFRLNKDEGAALAWFLSYWIGNAALKPGYQMRDLIEAEFEF